MTYTVTVQSDLSSDDYTVKLYEFKGSFLVLYLIDGRVIAIPDKKISYVTIK